MLKSVTSAPIKGKRVIVRVDFNVPIHDGKIIDDSRIKAALPTIQYILSKNPSQLILMSHLGRPSGVDESLSLKPIAAYLASILKKDVYPAPDCIDVNLVLRPIVLLENLRFHSEEEQDDPNFAKKLASLADVYVNDAFGTSHRAHASVHVITKLIPSYAGLLLQKEADSLGKAVEHLKRPYLAIIGGGKPDKVSLIQSLLKRVDMMVVVGVMANTILASRNIRIGRSKTDPHAIVLAKPFARDKKIILPVDVIVAKTLKSRSRVVHFQKVGKDEMILDIGPKTIKLIEDKIKQAKTIYWAGPAGCYEVPAFASGTTSIAKSLAKSNKTVIVGGGDSGAVLHRLKLESKITLISTGGGASIEYLEGKSLPGIEALRR